MPPTVSDTQVSNVLERAAVLLEPDGAWCQGQYSQMVDGKILARCVSMAISDAADGHGLLSALSRVYSVFKRAAGLRENSIVDIPNWNDKPERTQIEVVAKLREAAQLAKAEANT